MGYDKESNSIFNQYYLKVLKEAEEGKDGESDPDNFKAEGDKAPDADFTAVKPGDDSSKKSEDQAAQNAGIQPAGLDLNTGMAAPQGAPDSFSQIGPTANVTGVNLDAARAANQQSANAAASTAQNLGLQNYNMDTTKTGSNVPQKVDIATGTVGQGLMPTAAPNTATASAPATPQPATGPASDKEKELLKKFHASEFNPNSQVGQARLAELRQAAAQLGGDIDKIDPSRLASAAYAIQYKDSNPGLAAGYAKRANVNPLNPGKPGQPTGGTAVASAPATPAASTPSAAPTTAAATPGVTVPSWRNQPGVNQGQGPTQINAIKQAAQAAGLTMTDDQVNKFAKAMGIS